MKVLTESYIVDGKAIEINPSEVYYVNKYIIYGYGRVKAFS